jgi:flavin reductase (DIM6/NTAB) family NADH-FMN oxidoreductase RutF
LEKEPVERLIDTTRFRDIMSSFPSGVVVLTAFGEDGRPRGLTVSAFCAVSLEPPLALVSVDRTSNTLPAVQHSGGFTANILGTGRDELARRMATKLTDKFDGLAWRRPESKTGGPILESDAAAWAVCALRDTIEAGDHWLLVGLVTEGDHRADVRPMVFTRRAYA